MKKTWVIVLCSFVLGGGVVLGGVTLYNAGMNSVEQKAKQSESEKVTSSSSSSEKKESGESKQTKARSKAEDTKQAEPKTAVSEKPVEEKVAADPVLDAETTSLGQSRYSTDNPEILAIRKQLLKRWGEITNTTLTTNYRLNEVPGGFTVSDSTTPMGGIMNNNDGTYDFQSIAVEQVNGVGRMKLVTVGTEAVG